MRGSLLVASLLLVATAGCFGADVHVEPQLSTPGPGGSSSSPILLNQPPTASFVLLNETGLEAARHYVGEKLRADASASRDQDGRIDNYTWRVLRYGYIDNLFAPLYGAQVNLSFDSPGDRTLVLQVRDDQGASQNQYRSFGVNQHRIESGKLVLGQAPSLPISDPPLQAPVGAKNFSLPVVAGVLALSINATFPSDPSALIRLEIHAPNGTLLNRSEGKQAPLWAIAAPLPGVVGNYTAHLSLVTGVALDYRMEFIAWYGYY